MRPLSDRDAPAALRQDLAALEQVLAPFVSTMTRAAILDCALQRIRTAGQPTSEALRAEVAKGLRLFVENPEIAARCAAHVLALGAGPPRPPTPSGFVPHDRPRPSLVPGLHSPDHPRPTPPSVAPDRTTQVLIRMEEDIVKARRVARDLAAHVGFGEPARVKIATAVSELARNAWMYAGGGEATMHALRGLRHGLEVRVTDHGPGITVLQEALAGRYRSRTGMGAGLRGTRALVDDFEVETAPGAGTRITIRKFL